MEKIRIKANGKEYETEVSKTVSEFVADFGLKPERCLVEINGAVLKFADFKSRQLKEGDILEIMALVAGG